MRYIHLNPLRGKLVRDLARLDRFPYAGHSTLMGKRTNDWQDTGAVLAWFGPRVGAARARYRAFVETGIALGRWPELIGGGLIRSLGGWTKVKALRKGEVRLKRDERILGEPTFVLDVLEACEEHLQRQYKLQSQGYDLDRVARRVAPLFGLAPGAIYTPSKRPRLVAARSLFCYWAVRELGVSATSLARAPGMTQPAVSIAALRGEKIATGQGLRLVDG